MSDTKRHDDIQGEILHEYDGILEADNRLPNWWLATFFGSIVFAIGYWGWYEAFEVTPDLRAEYAATMMARAGDMAEPTPELIETAAADPSLVASGRSTYEAQCVICHGQNAEGVVGPNLTDASWIHGGAPMAVYRTIRTGVLARGMPAWGEQLPPQVVLGVTAYVMSIRNTNVTGGRAPEGELGGSDDPEAAVPTEPATPAAEGEAVPPTGGEVAPAPATDGDAAPSDAAPSEVTAPEAAPSEGAAPTEAPAPATTEAAAEPAAEPTTVGLAAH